MGKSSLGVLALAGVLLASMVAWVAYRGRIRRRAGPDGLSSGKSCSRLRSSSAIALQGGRPPLAQRRAFSVVHRLETIPYTWPWGMRW